MAELASLAEAVGALVHDGDVVALEGFTHLIPHAAGHELIRQDRRHLHLVRMTPDVVYDQLIGMGCADGLTFGWGGNPGVGSLHRLRDAVEQGWPGPLRLDENSHAALAARYVAGAAGLPFGVLRGYAGTDLVDHITTVAPIECPFTGEQLAAVPAMCPDVTIIHAQRADRTGNVQIWGLVGIQKEAALAARRCIVTVEEVVAELDPRPGAIVLPTWVLSAVCLVPNGAHPSFAMGYSERDNAFYRAWDGLARDRDTFTSWMRRHVLATADHAEHLRSIATEGAGV